jgi:tetratricopeptide (TPR) repeat protein
MLTDADASTLESHLLRKPTDEQARVDLIWHYRGRFGDSAAQDAADRHVLWLIEHQPAAAVLASPAGQIAAFPDRAAFNRAKELWQRHIDGSADPKVLGNAGVFFAGDDVERAASLLDKAQAGDAASLVWPMHLGDVQLDRAAALQGLQRRLAAAAALAAYQRAIRLSQSDAQRLDLLQRAAGAALAAELGEESLGYIEQARQLIAAQPDDGDAAAARHNLWVTQGRCALQQRKADEAAACLLKAGQSLGNHRVLLSQVNMALAAELLAAGKRVEVSKYLAACEAAAPGSGVKAWMEAIERGQSPDMAAYVRMH